MPVLSHKYRLYPTQAQVAGMEAMLGAFGDLYNAALQQRIEAYRRRRKTLRYADQADDLKAVRAADERLAGDSFSAEQQVLRRLDKAFQAFFRRLTTQGKAGFPRFQAKARFDSVEVRVGDGLTIRKNKRLRVVGIPGEVKATWHRPLPPGAKLGAAVLSQSAGHWSVCFQVTVPDGAVAERDGAAVGIDAGLTSLVATSDGEGVPTPPWTKRAAKTQRRLQRALSRCKRGSQRRRKAKQRLARHSARTANQRRDFLHKLSRSLVDRDAVIALEDLSVERLARSMLAKSVHTAAWGQRRSFLDDKAANACVRVEAVDPRGTRQTCPECGAVVAKTRADRTHRCDCGCVMDRDGAAATVILQRAHGTGPGHGLRTPSQRGAAELVREAVALQATELSPDSHAHRAAAAALTMAIQHRRPPPGASCITPTAAAKSESSGRRNSLTQEVAMRKQKRRSDRSGQVRSPARPPSVQREDRRLFWAAIAMRQSSEDAASLARVSPAAGTLVPRGGAMPPAKFVSSATLPSERDLQIAERRLRCGMPKGSGVREIARQRTS